MIFFAGVVTVTLQGIFVLGAGEITTEIGLLSPIGMATEKRFYESIQEQTFIEYVHQGRILH